MSKRTWVALDSWAFVKGEATDDNIETMKRQLKENWAHVPGSRVRVFRRVVRAGGAGIPVACVVAQAPRQDVARA